MSKINNVQMSTIENKHEQMWFSILKQLTRETDFGSVEISLTIRSHKITNVAVINKANFNIGS